MKVRLLTNIRILTICFLSLSSPDGPKRQRKFQNPRQVQLLPQYTDRKKVYLLIACSVVKGSLHLLPRWPLVGFRLFNISVLGTCMIKPRPNILHLSRACFSFFPIEWAFFGVSTTANGLLKVFIRCISGKDEVLGWAIHPPISLILKKGTKTFD